MGRRITRTMQGGLMVALVAIGLSTLPAAGAPQGASAARDVADSAQAASRTTGPGRTAVGSSAAPDDCGAPLVKSDGTSWSCTFSDDFDGDSLDRSRWLPQTSGYTTGDATNFACYKDDSEHVAVSEGSLRLRLTEGPAEPCPGLKDKVTRFSAGSVSTYRLFSQKYGRFEARMRNTAASVPGLHEAFWLWPDDRFVNVSRWPVSGEIDIAETYSRYPDLAVPFLHSRWDALGPVPGLNTAWNCRAARGTWNTYALEWTPTTLEIFVNGSSCLRVSGTDSAFQEPYIIAFTQGLGGAQNEYRSETPLPATLEVDYIRVWA